MERARRGRNRPKSHTPPPPRDGMEDAGTPVCLDDLPLDVAYLLLNELPAQDRARAACVCRSWRALLAAPGAWSHLRLSSLNESALRLVCARAEGELLSLVVSSLCAPEAVLEVVAANASLRSLVVEPAACEAAPAPRWRVAHTAPLLRLAHVSLPHARSARRTASMTTRWRRLETR